MDISEKLPGIGAVEILKMADSYQDFHLLFTAVNYDIFSTLSQKTATADKIANEIETDPYITEKLLNGLVSIGLLNKFDNEYSNTALSETFLIKEKPFFQGNYVKTAKPISFGTNIYDDWAKIGQAIDKGYFNPDDKAPSAPRLHDKSFSLAMKEGAIRGEVQETAEVLSGYQWFKQAKKLLDIGGTHGLYSIAFACKNPELKVTIFDFPGVPELAGAANLIKYYGMENRIEIVEGDFVGGNIGKGYDIAFISHVYFQGDRLKNILKNIHQALNENQWFILKNCVINKNRKDRFAVSLHDLDMCFWSAEQHMFSIDEYIDQIEAYGFKIENMAKIEDCPYSPSTILMFRKTG